jgi:hypothetical protein
MLATVPTAPNFVAVANLAHAIDVGERSFWQIKKKN